MALLSGLTAREARWLALEGQGVSSPRPRRIDTTRLLNTARTIGAVQLDAINVLERTQFLVMFSRLGPYDRDAFHGLTKPSAGLWEYWGHAASLQPVEHEPLFRWRYQIGGGYEPGSTVEARMDAWRAATAEYATRLLEEVRDRGPLTAAQLTDPRRRQGEWWDRRSLGRQVLEDLFGRGILSAWRTASFERVYDLRERVLPDAVLAEPTPSTEEAQRSLVLDAARAYGVATAADLAGYYFLKRTVAKARIAELVADGALVPVQVEGWDEVAYCLPAARLRRPRRDSGTLLSPFDPIVWDRARTSRLFGFDFKIEVYVPAPKRVYGYYVLPFLLGDQLVGRFDLKSDRKQSALRVVASHAEPGVDIGRVAESAAAELERMQRWLGLDRLVVEGAGDLADTLRQ